MTNKRKDNMEFPQTPCYFTSNTQLASTKASHYSKAISKRNSRAL